MIFLTLLLGTSKPAYLLLQTVSAASLKSRHDTAFDENLSPKLPHLLGSRFPDSLHVRQCGLKGQPDQAIWNYAGANGFTLVSKDVDFYQRSRLFGAPPKFIWICIGNCSRERLYSLLVGHETDIRAFEFAAESVLTIS